MKQKAVQYQLLKKKFNFMNLNIGDSCSVTKKITIDLILNFANISGDFNPVHIDPEYAKNTIFKQPIAHGLISASLFSGVFGTKIPGENSLYISQNLKFRNPVFVNDEVEAIVTITKIDKRRNWFYFDTICKNLTTKKIIITGEAIIFKEQKKNQ